MPSTVSSRTIAITAIATAAVSISLVAAAIFVRRRRRPAQGSACCSSELEAKPQYAFKRVLADNSHRPFEHYKVDGEEKGVSLKVHPYEDSIASLLDNPPMLPKFVTTHQCPDLGSSFLWVDTLEQLESLVEILKKEEVFAVDTEQHSVRSFLGFTALMQISTHKEDFLVDTIALHDVMGILRPVFADPCIVKVFHGADNDILWLQRDFHIYVVNLFDTAKACGVLSKPQKSLAFLLETYCGVVTNKKLQREDWRARPLSEAMVNYARIDAHYLLFIANCLLLELKSEYSDESINEAYRRSNMICLQLYAKEKETSHGDSAAASIFSRYCNLQGSSWKMDHTKELIRRLCTWRDLMARIHDESLRYVLSDQAIASLSEKVHKEHRSVCTIIKQADTGRDILNMQSVPSLSPIVEGHLEDVCCILEEIMENTDDVFRKIFRRYLNNKKKCPLSIYNYVILSELNDRLTKTLFPKENGGKTEVPMGRKASRQLFVLKFSCKSPVYHNCRIFASDGRLLCYCDRRKLEWYLRRNLAKLVEDDPPAIMLLFEPKGRPEDEDNEFYIQSKRNMCVGCGEKNHYLRYRIIPSCYRIHFPEHLKSHRSHDIVLLCVSCHEIAHTAAEKYKRQVAAEFGIPLFVKKVIESGENEIMTDASIIADKQHKDAGVSPLQLRTAAMALVRHGSRMPPSRQEELREIIKAYFGGREISESDLETALLVGMSPAERRKLERKRGLPFRLSEKHADFSISESVVEETLESSVDLGNNTYALNQSTFEKMDIHLMKDNNGGGEICLGIMSDLTEQVEPILGLEKSTESWSTSNMESVEYNMGEHEDGSFKETLSRQGVSSISAKCYCGMAHASIEKCADERQCSCRRENVTCSNYVHSNSYKNENLPNGNGTSSVSYRHSSHKYAKKVSLLGHGPHGRQVVECIQAEKGEDGILQFCQRWRRVFVESVNPRFLPAGWDIMHSGRREFGKFSVYNPRNGSEADE